MSNLVFELNDVGFTYGDAKSSFTALKGVNLAIAPGEFVAIVGASGSGKSTLLNLLGLMSTPSSGELRILGQRVSELSDIQASALRGEGLGFVFQHDFLLEDLTVMENILLPTSYSASSTGPAAARTRAEELMRSLGIGGLGRRRPTELSGGQRQRVAICRSLMMNPRVILADEPTGALDSENTDAVMAILRQLHQDGMTIVLVTHDSRLAEQASRRIVVADGKIVEDSGDGASTSSVDGAEERNAIRFANAGKRISEHSHRTPHLFSMVGMALHNMRVMMKANRRRALLTLSGFVLGVSSIVVFLSLALQLETTFKESFRRMGLFDVVLTLSGGDGPADFSRSELEKIEASDAARGLDLELSTAFALELRSPWDASWHTLSAHGLSSTRTIESLHARLLCGSWPDVADATARLSGADVVLGVETAEKLFGQGKLPCGTTVSAHANGSGATLRVSGIVQESTATPPLEAGSLRSGVLMSEKILALLRGDAVSTIRASTSGLGEVRSTTARVAQILQPLVGVGQQLHVASSLRDAGQVEDISRNSLVVILVLSSMCILVGGVSIMNIMLSTLSERFSEVGIKRSVGATKTHVLLQFNAETILFCSLGGLIGTVLGVAASNGLLFLAALVSDGVMEFHPLIEWRVLTLAAGISLVSGFAFGLWPALQASRTSIITALNRE